MVTGIRERFGKGLSTEEKLADSNKRVGFLNKNLSIMLGGIEITGEITEKMAEYVKEVEIRDHFAAALVKKEAERKAREAEAKIAAERQALADKFAGVIAAVAARGGSSDPADVMAKIREMSADDLSALLQNAPGGSK